MTFIDALSWAMQYNKGSLLRPITWRNTGKAYSITDHFLTYYPAKGAGLYVKFTNDVFDLLVEWEITSKEIVDKE